MRDRGRGFPRVLTQLTVFVVVLASLVYVGAGVTSDFGDGDRPGPLEGIEIPEIGLPDVVEPPDERDNEPAVEPPATEPPGTDSPATEPPGTDSPATEPPGTDSPATDQRTEPAADLDRAEIEYAVHEQVNERRTAHEVGALAFDDDLREIARYHSLDMAERNYFAHTSPDGDTLGDRYERFGYDCRVPTGDGRYMTGGENLFWIEFPAGTYDETEIAEQAVEGWMHSEGHRENMLTDHWEHQGIGVVITEGEDEGTVSVYVTQNFC